MTIDYRVNKYILTNVIYFYFIQPFDNDTNIRYTAAVVRNTTIPIYYTYMYTRRYHGARYYCTRTLITITQNIFD